MQLSERDNEVLASLADTPAFVLLMRLFQEYENELLEAVVETSDSTDLVRRTRYYQLVRKVRVALQTRPTMALDALREQQQAQAEAVDPSTVSMQDMWFKRFGAIPE